MGMVPAIHQFVAQGTLAPVGMRPSPAFRAVFLTPAIWQSSHNIQRDEGLASLIPAQAFLLL